MRGMELPDQAGLVSSAAGALRAAAGEGWALAQLEWSQAGTQHSGRAVVLDAGSSAPRRIFIPDDAVTALATLRETMSRPGTGTWLSVALSLTPEGEPEARFNYEARPYWNSTTASMLDNPVEAPVPAEDRWLADLRRHPRDRAHVPAWLAPETIDGEAVAELRAALEKSGIGRPAVVLPGESFGPALEGTVEIVKHGPGHFALQITDYGQHEFLAEYRTEREACGALWQYVTSPLPQPVPITTADLTARARASGASYADLHRRLAAAGPGGIITNLAPGLPYDRIGGLDGLYFFAWNTPWEQRSLPDSARGPGAQQVTLVARQPVEIQAELVPAWFDQPGGGIRFRVEERHRGMRDLVRSGTLSQVHVVG